MNSGTRKIGILASPNTIKSRLHSRLFNERDVITLNSSGIERTSQIIHGVIAGRGDLSEPLAAQINSLLLQGAEKVLLGCTELSVISHTEDFTDVIDPLDLAVEEIMKDNV